MTESKIQNFFSDTLEKRFTPLSAIVSPITKNVVGCVENGDRTYDFVFSDRKEIKRVNQTIPLGAGSPS